MRADGGRPRQATYVATPWPTPTGQDGRPLTARPRPGGTGSNRSTKPTDELDDWPADRLAEIRRIIREADSEAVEERKWRKPSMPGGVPVWSHDGILCVGNSLKNRVRLTFPKGAALQDPKGLFNTRLDSKTVRAIDIPDGESINEGPLKDLIRRAAKLNVADSKAKR